MDSAAADTVKMFYGKATPLVLAMFMTDRALRRTEAADSWSNDVVAACPGMAMASLHAKAGHRAWVYPFHREIPGDVSQSGDPVRVRDAQRMALAAVRAG